LPSRKGPLRWLAEKEWRELISARAWWILLLAMGPLTGVSFISASRTYAEMSGLGGEILSPLIGVWAPTFGACELAALFLLPFVAIRIVAGDRQSGALKLELQNAIPAFARIAAKALVLFAGWLFAMLPPLSAVLLWKLYGGSVYPPEVLAVVAGHVLNAGLTIALAAAMASAADHPATAAILTLSFTTGTWIVDFFAAVKGGWWERAASYTPTTLVADFQHGLLRLDAIAIAMALILAGLTVAVVWMHLGVPVRRRALQTAGTCLLAGALVWACSFARASWDVSENRANSFSEADETALRSLPAPLRIEAHLAPEDPRRADLERHVLEKLRRLLPRLQVDYIAATTSGLFEQSNNHYGEIWYELGGRKLMSRLTNEEGVLEIIYELSGVAPAANAAEPVFRGHPLLTPPRNAALLFYVLWPALMAISGLAARRRSN
jgi:hypothetical protein